jgi:hypothetical protein
MQGPGRKREVRPTVGQGVGGKRHDDLATKARSEPLMIATAAS